MHLISEHPLPLGEPGRAAFVVGQVLAVAVAVEVLLPAVRLKGGRDPRPRRRSRPSRAAFELRRLRTHHGHTLPQSAD
ncbi:hypothetical protein ABZ958_36445 [Streptomyces sp. NPDC046237]|uniref:hypothetical protein n=1 Tax=Streptomyces sp. NPDC046237 TaxID=3154914 RepID=UPI0033C8489B